METGRAAAATGRQFDRLSFPQGRIKRVSGNQATAPGAPTAGFDCHVSQHLASVTTRTSFSLAFERTQVKTMAL